MDKPLQIQFFYYNLFIAKIQLNFFQIYQNVLDKIDDQKD